MQNGQRNYIKRIFSAHGLSKSIVSDRDPRFTASFFQRSVFSSWSEAADEHFQSPADGRDDGTCEPCCGILLTFFCKSQTVVLG